MAQGTDSRGRKITIRVSEELYDKLSNEAMRKNINISECIRQKLNSNDQNTEIIAPMCSLLTSINRLFYRYDIAQEDKEQIDQEVREVWRHLN